MSSPEPLILNPGDLRIEIQTSTEGPLSALGHSPRFRLESLTAKYISQERVMVTMEAASLALITPGIKESDQKKILQTAREQVLQSQRFPVIRFEGQVRYEPASPQVTGELHLLGQTRPVNLRFERQSSGDFLSRTSLLLKDFGITPPSALLGAIRCRNELEIEISVRLPAAAGLPGHSGLR